MKNNQHFKKDPEQQTLMILSLAATNRMAALLSAQVVLFNSLNPVGQAQEKEGG